MVWKGPSKPKGVVTRCDFTSGFQSTFSGMSIRVDCWGGHMIQFYNRFSINLTYSIFLLLWKKSLWRHDSRQRVDCNLDALQIFNYFQALLSTKVVTRYNFSRKQIRWENLMENLIENRIVWPHLYSLSIIMFSYLA